MEYVKGLRFDEDVKRKQTYFRTYLKSIGVCYNQYCKNVKHKCAIHFMCRRTVCIACGSKEDTCSERRTEIDMRFKKGLGIMCFSALMLALSSLFGCGNDNIDKPSRPGKNKDVSIDQIISGEPVEGGTVINNDKNAPKEIKSKEITGYYFNFGLSGEWSEGRENAFYTFEIKENGSGVLTVYEQTTGISAPADEEILKSLQDIIDKYELVKMNGRYHLTAGLPPEFAASNLNVDYASGENLSITDNNNPNGEAEQETYLAFSKWFSKNGINDLLIPGPEGEVTYINLELYDREKDEVRFYSVVTGDEPVFSRYLNGRDKDIEIPEDFYKDVTEIVGKYDLLRYDIYSSLYGYEQTPEDKSNPFGTDIQLLIEFENGHKVDLRSSADSVKEDVSPLIEELITYYNGLFE